jgi:hypothetical protein
MARSLASLGSRSVAAAVSWRGALLMVRRIWARQILAGQVHDHRLGS